MHNLKSQTYLLSLSLSLWLCGSTALADLDSASLEAYHVARNWLARGSVPDQTVTIPAPNVAAVHVTLRTRGITVGQGTAAASNPPPLASDTESAETDLMPLIVDAMRQAMREGRLALAETDQKDVVLDLQVARPLEPVKLKTIRDLPGQITLHGHGLAMSREGRWAWSFPGSAVAANTDLPGQLLRLSSQLDLPLDRQSTIGTPDGPPLFRFDALHITVPVGGGEPVRLYRGHELLPTEPLEDQSLALLGEQLADYLVERQRDDGRFAGTYEPTADRYQPETADVSATAYAAYALARTAKLGGVSGAHRDKAARLAVDALVGLIGKRDLAGRQVIGRDAEATAITLLAITESTAEHKAARESLTLALRSMADGAGRVRASTASDAPASTPETQALAAAALVAVFDQTREPALLELASRILAVCWQAIDPETEYRLLPWVVAAEAQLMRLGRPTPQAPKVAALGVRMRERQVLPWGEEPRRSAPDAIGGFLVGSRIFDEPTIDSAPVLAGLAVALRQREFVPEEQRVKWIVGCGLGARFINQLTLQPSGAYYTKTPQDAIGGARVSLWDNRQPLRSTAAALLAITELRISLAELVSR